VTSQAAGLSPHWPQSSQAHQAVRHAHSPAHKVPGSHLLIQSIRAGSGRTVAPTRTISLPGPKPGRGSAPSRHSGALRRVDSASSRLGGWLSSETSPGSGSPSRARLAPVATRARRTRHRRGRTPETGRIQVHPQSPRRSQAAWGPLSARCTAVPCGRDGRRQSSTIRQRGSLRALMCQARRTTHRPQRPSRTVGRHRRIVVAKPTVVGRRLHLDTDCPGQGGDFEIARAVRDRPPRQRSRPTPPAQCAARAGQPVRQRRPGRCEQRPPRSHPGWCVRGLVVGHGRSDGHGGPSGRVVIAPTGVRSGSTRWRWAVAGRRRARPSSGGRFPPAGRRARTRSS